MLQVTAKTRMYRLGLRGQLIMRERDAMHTWVDLHESIEQLKQTPDEDKGERIVTLIQNLLLERCGTTDQYGEDEFREITPEVPDADLAIFYGILEAVAAMMCRKGLLGFRDFPTTYVESM